MQNKAGNYVKDTKGTVTIDWVIIMGFLAGLVLSLSAAISPGLETRGTEIVDPATILTTF